MPSGVIANAGCLRIELCRHRCDQADQQARDHSAAVGPQPPMVTMTNAGMMACDAIPGVTDQSGAATRPRRRRACSQRRTRRSARAAD